MDVVRSELFEKVSVHTLTDILDKNSFPDRIGILKIDTESWDYNVLKGFDFNKYKVDVIVTEEYYWKFDDTLGKHLMLEDAGYVNAGFVGYNSLWINKANGARFSYSLMKDWLSLVTRYPENVMGEKNITKTAPELQRHRSTTPVFDIKSPMIVAPFFDVMSGISEPITVAVVNLSDKAIPSIGKSGNPISLSYRWLDLDGTTKKWDNARFPIKQDIASGATLKMTVPLCPPDKSGQYILYFDLVDEGVIWLSELGLMPSKQRVTVILDDIV